MKKMIPMLTAVLLIMITAAALAGQADTEVAEQMTALEGMCEKSGEARSARHDAKPLYERLGGYDRIYELTTEIVRLHAINDNISWTLKGVDHQMLAKHVADFMAAGTGGVVSYTGRDMESSHRRLELTDAHFLSAGGDVIQAMQNLEYGQEEIDEVVCILVSLKDQVVLD